MSKLKIMQQGGGLIYTPFIPGAQGAVKQSTSRSNTSEGESKIDALDKELIALMKNENLLPSDIENISKQIIAFQRKASQYAAIGDYSSVMPGMYQIQAQIQKAQFAKKQSDAAEQRMASENAGSEVALDNYGRMYVQDKDGNLSKVSTSDYDSEKYIPISNSQLLYLRQTSASDNGQIFMDIKNTVGMETVQKEMSEIIKNFGTIKGDKFEKRKMQDIANDLSEGVFKITEKYSKADLNDFSGLLLSQLSKDAQHRITANAKLHGMNERDYVRTIIASRTSPERSESYESSMTKAVSGDSGSGNGSGSEKTVKDTYAERLVSGDGLGPMQQITIMGRDSNAALHVYAQDARYVFKDQQKMENLSLRRALNQADAIGGIVDSKSITFGDQLIDSKQADKLMIDNDEIMYRAWLPYKRTQDGRITPDFETLKLLEKAQAFVDSKSGYVVPAEINAWLEQNGIDAHWDSDKKQIVFNNSKMLPFLILHGIAGSNRLDFDTRSSMLHHLDRPEGKAWKDDYDRIVTETMINGKLEHQDEKGSKAGKYYMGNIYLAITNPVAGAMIYNDQYFPQDTYINITQKAENSEARRQIITNFN